MKKKWISALSILAVTAGLLTGCGSGTKMNNYSKNITLGEYIGIEYTPMSTEVTDEEVQEQMDSLLQNLGTTEEVTEGTVENGDTINLDYIGYVDGEAFEGGDTEGNGTELTIGSGSYIDDFEEQLIGHTVGEEGIEVNVTFPEDYQNSDGTISDLAGKDATFVCTINSIVVTTYPEEWTDELAAENTDYETVNSLTDAVKMQYESYKETQAEQQMKADIITAIMDDTEVIAYPEEETQELLDQTIQGAKDTAESYGLEYADYLAYLTDENGDPYTEDSYYAAAEEYMKELMKEKMVICEIARLEGMSVTKSEVQAYVEAECASDTSLDADTIYDSYSMEDLAYSVLYDKVMNFLVEQAVAVQ